MAPRPRGSNRRFFQRSRGKIGKRDLAMAPPKNQERPRLRVVSDAETVELSARPIQRPTGLVEEVYNRVRAEIMSLGIPPDTRVTIESLARRQGGSQPPQRQHQYK